ncbi:hypothetical protein HUT19_40095 [Streptomyces sp. NA02950]|uniref:hypothetical protein n=1 Tax=Streptomyces sp. NA02950 TaxID=2742137 RepID=UPI001591235E|nr:hypothetical protein [Streptomyces sp. NA02950]QKV97121.1 hypothetical protein HUT19_40095 [Streptomyces sp. NA02950]
MSNRHVVYDRDGRITAELPLDRKPYELLVKAVMGWTDPLARLNSVDEGTERNGDDLTLVVIHGTQARGETEFSFASSARCHGRTPLRLPRRRHHRSPRHLHRKARTSQGQAPPVEDTANETRGRSGDNS